MNTSTKTELSNAVGFKVRDIQGRADPPVACGHASFEVASHATAFVRLSKTDAACTPTAPPQCTAPAPLPPTPSPTPPPRPHGPPPPLPPCPAGFAKHSSGYWAEPDQKGPAGHSKSVVACGKYCLSKTGCTAFEVSILSPSTKLVDQTRSSFRPLSQIHSQSTHQSSLLHLYRAAPDAPGFRDLVNYVAIVSVSDLWHDTCCLSLICGTTLAGLRPCNGDRAGKPRWLGLLHLQQWLETTLHD